MKSPLKLLTKILYLNLLLALLSCKQQQKEHLQNSQQPAPIEVPNNIISLQEAHTIYNNYTIHRISLIESYETQKRASEEKFRPSRFVDFDYETIKQYIDYVDQEAEKAGVEKVTKLRLYFANYPDNDTFPNGKKVIHKRQNSIFIVPTLEMEGINYGFYIGNDGNAALIKNWEIAKNNMGLSLNRSEKAYSGFINNSSLNSNLETSKSLTLNFGHGGPPPETDF